MKLLDAEITFTVNAYTIFQRELRTVKISFGESINVLLTFRAAFWNIHIRETSVKSSYVLMNSSGRRGDTVSLISVMRK